MSKNRNAMSVNGKPIPTPSSMKFGFQDVSSSDAGRTEDGTMWKMEICKKMQISLVWSGCNSIEASEILTAFDPEYVDVNFHDPKTNSRITKNFYTGDRSAPVRRIMVGNILYENVAFSIIER